MRFTTKQIGLAIVLVIMSWAVLRPVQSAEPEAKRERWEYKVETTTGMIPVPQLNSAGSDRWELVTIAVEQTEIAQRYSSVRGSNAMSGNIDILLRLPDVATIGRAKLQDYCDQWLQRPIARDFGISHLIVGGDLMLTVNLDAGSVEWTADKAFIPICELLDYIIDQHFQDAAKRKELHAQAYDLRKRWGELGYQYEAMAGRVGNLWLKCKNPACDVSFETAQQAVEGQIIHCPPTSVTCPGCGHTDLYDGSDLHLRLEAQ